MHDISWIRENPDEFDQHMQRRGLPPQAQRLLELDSASRNNQSSIQQLQERANKIAKKIGTLMAQSKRNEATPLMEESKLLKQQISIAKDSEDSDTNNELHQALLDLPNLVDATTPDGTSEDDNVEISRHGTQREFSFTPKSHDELGIALGGLDFNQTAKISGTRFATLKGQIAKLERALANLMLDTHTNNGYTEISPPLLVKPDAMIGTSQLPKFTEDAFTTTDGRWLISTAEISITNLVRESIIEPEQLPIRMVAHTPCFRSEAGSAGRDTKGLVRLHQFNKVELVSITTPKQAEVELTRKLAAAESVLQLLELPYRVVQLCTGDLGFSALKTFDIEVWMPAQNCYREISSISHCGSFQARRMDARYRLAETADGRKTSFLHTLNGSGLAVGRTLVAVLENYQQKDGSITVPKVLQGIMGDAL